MSGEYLKKLFSCVLAIVFIFTVPLLILNASASVTPEFTVSTVTGAHFGDTVTVEITSNGAGDFLAGQFVLYYDSGSLSPLSLTEGSSAGEYFVGNTSYGNNCISFAMMDVEPIDSSGVIASVDFELTGRTLFYEGDLNLTVKSLVADIPIGYGYKNISSSVNNGKIYASAVLTVPEADDPSAIEQLGLYNLQNNCLVTGRTWNNLSVVSLDANFDEELERFYYTKTGAPLTGSQLLTTGCYFTVGDGFFTQEKAVRGDVDGDYSSDGYDAFLAQAIAVGALTSDNTDEANLRAADADNDGDVDADDFSILEQNGLAG